MKATINIGPYDEIIGQLQALDSMANELDMGRLRLHQFSTEQIVNMINSIPEQVKILDLGSYGSNYLYEKSRTELAQIYAATGRKNLDQLILQHTGIILNPQGGIKTREELVQLIALWPKTLKVFDLSYQDLHRSTPEDFEAIFAVKPPKATTLNLGCNSFDLESAEKMSQILKLIPSDFNTLIFELATSTERFKNNYPASEFKKILMAIPSTITNLDLDFTQIHRLSIDYLNQLEGALPAVTTFCVCGSEIDQMSKAQLVAFAKIVPNADNVVIKDYSGNIATSEKIIYFQSKIEAQAQKSAMKTIHALSQLSKGVPDQNGRPTRRAPPEDIITHLSEFFPRSEEIRKGIKALRENNAHESNSNTNSPKSTK